MLKSAQFYLFKHWKELERGAFAPYFGRPIPIKSISFRGFAPDKGLCLWTPLGLRPHTPVICSRSRARHVLVPEPLNQTPPMCSGPSCVLQRCQQYRI